MLKKINCSHCNKEIGRDDKFIFTHHISFNTNINHNDESKCFCCVECAKLDEPMLEIFINDMIVKNVIYICIVQIQFSLQMILKKKMNDLE